MLQNIIYDSLIFGAGSATGCGGGASSTVSAGFIIAYEKLKLEPLRKKAEEELRELKLERHKEVLCKLEEQKTLIEALKDDVDALK